MITIISRIAHCDTHFHDVCQVYYLGLSNSNKWELASAHFLKSFFWDGHYPGLHMHSVSGVSDIMA